MKKIFIIAFFLAGVCTINAQNFHFDWAVEFGGSASSSYGSSIATDASGNVYSSGYFSGTVDFDPGPGNYFLTSGNTLFGDIFISKLDAAGNFIWAKQMKTVSGGGGVTSIALDPQGNVYTFGNFSGTVDFDPGPGVSLLSCPACTFISKLDPAGNYIWAEQLSPGTHNGGDHSMTVDAAGNIFMTGSFYGSADFDPGPGIFNITSGAGGSNWDAYILKLNTNGAFVWVKRFTSSSSNVVGEGSSIALDNDGNIYSTGYYSGTFDFDPGPGVYNLTDIGVGPASYISKLDPAGNFLWGQSNTGGIPGGIAVDNTGNVYTTQQVNDNKGYKDVFVAKQDGAGKSIWSQVLGGTGQASGRSLVLDAAGNVYLTGTFKGTLVLDPGSCLGTYTSAGTGSDIFVSELKSDGTILWLKQFAGTVYHNDVNVGFSIAIDIFGDICTTGYFANTVDFDPGIGVFNLPSPDNFTVFVQKMIPCVASTSSVLNILSCGPFNYYCQTYTTSGVYTQIISNETGCDSIVTLNLTINPVSVSNLKQTICSGQSYEGYSATGTFTDTLASVIGCDSIRTIQLTVMNAPAPYLGTDKSLCIGDTMTLFPGNFDSYKWQDGSTQSHYIINKSGEYSVNVSNFCGSALAQISVVENKCGMYFPTAFTPNKDGKNDLFKILHPPDFASYDLSVFNRWGQKVFDTRDYTKGWDGTLNGQLLDTGVFVWFCKYQKTNSALHSEISGTVVLIR